MKILVRILTLVVVISAIIVFTQIALAQTLADYGDAPENDEKLFVGPGSCTGVVTNYPSRFASDGPYHTDLSDVVLGPLPNTVTAEENAKLPNCDDWIAPVYDEDDGPIALFIPPASGWLYIPSVPAGGVFGPAPPAGCNLAYWVFRVSVNASAPSTVPRFANVVTDLRCFNANLTPSGVYGDDLFEWALVNEPVTAAPGTTQIMITRPFYVLTAPTKTNWEVLPFWTRFTVTRNETIDPAKFAPAGWNGSGPSGGFTWGETEDLLVYGDPPVPSDNITPPPVKVDIFPNSMAKVRIDTLFGSDTVALSGQTVVYTHVGTNGQAKDTDGDGLDQVGTEMVAMELTGTSKLLGPLAVRLRHPARLPFRHSTGEIEENVNNIKSILDIPPFATRGAAQSFFDVFFEIELLEPPAPGLKLLHNEIPNLMNTTITYEPSAEGETYENSNEVRLFNEEGSFTGITLGSFSFMPNPRLPPVVTDPHVNQSDIPDDTDGEPRWGEVARLDVKVVDNTEVASVSVDLSEIGGASNKVMKNIGGNIYSTTTNASAGTLPKIYNLTVNATDIFGNSNTSLSIQLRVMKNGDATGNGVVNIGDALRCANNVSYPGNPVYALSSLYVVEVTGNGVINIGDCLRIANNVSYPGNQAYILK